MPLKRRNFEKTGRDISAGPWRIASLADPITEKRYLQFALRLRSPAVFSPLVVEYRTEAARLIAGNRCLAPASTTVENDRIEILTPWAEIAALDRLEETDAAALVDAVLRVLLLFENHAFFASDLFPETIAKDDAGRWILLPAAYAIPIRGDTRSPGAPWMADSRARSASSGFRYPADDDRGGHHARLVGEFVSKHLRTFTAAGRRGPSSFRERLARTAQAIARGEIVSTAAVYERLFDAPLEKELLPRGGARGGEREKAPEGRVLECVERILDRAAQEGSVTVLEGETGSGKTRALADSVKNLRERENTRLSFSMNGISTRNIARAQRRRAGARLPRGPRRTRCGSSTTSTRRTWRARSSRDR